MAFGPHLLLATLEGLVTSAVLALMALGLSLVFGVMRVVNVAHGEFFMLGAVLAWAIASAFGGHPAIGFLAALVCRPLIVGAVALVAERLVLRRLNYNPEATIVATIGMLYIIQQLALSFYGPEARPVAAPFNYRILLPWFGYSGYKLSVIAASILLLAATWFVLTRTKIGLVMRATQYDSETAQAFGIPVGRVYAGVFARGRHACGHRRRADRADQPGALPDGPRSAAAFLHRRHHRRARLAARHGGRGPPDRRFGRRHLGVLLADAGQDHRHAAGRHGAGLPAAGPVRHGLAMREDSGPGKAIALHAAVIALLFALNFVLPEYHHGVLARVMVLAVFAMGYNLLFGYVGLLSLGHAMFFAAGLYGAGLTVYHLGWGMPAGFAAGLVCWRGAVARHRPARAAHHRRRLHDRHHDVRAGLLSARPLFREMDARRRGPGASAAGARRRRSAISIST